MHSPKSLREAIEAAADYKNTTGNSLATVANEESGLVFDLINSAVIWFEEDAEGNIHEVTASVTSRIVGSNSAEYEEDRWGPPSAHPPKVLRLSDPA